MLWQPLLARPLAPTADAGLASVCVVLACSSLLLAIAPQRLRLSSRSGLSPGSSALQQPGDLFIHDERDARAGEHPDDIRCQAAVESYEGLMRPSVCDRGRDSAVVRARGHRVILVGLVCCMRESVRRTMGSGSGGLEGVRGVGSRHLDAGADHLVRVCCAKRGEVRRARHERLRGVGLHVKSLLH